MTDDRANAPICPWCGERLEMLKVGIDTGNGAMLVPFALGCESETCEYGLSLTPQPVLSAPVASGSVGRA